MFTEEDFIELRMLLQWVLIECWGKQKFDGPQGARHAVRHMRGKSVNVYRCHWCRDWHVGGAAPKSAIRTVKA